MAHEQCFLILTIAFWGKYVNHSEDSYPFEGHSERKLRTRYSKLCVPTPDCCLLIPAMLLEGLFVPEANRLGEVAKTKGFPTQRMSNLQPCELPRPHSLFSPSEEEEEPEDGERRLLSRGPWELQVGRTGVVQQGFRSPYSCSQDPAVGLQRVLGQVGQ